MIFFFSSAMDPPQSDGSGPAKRALCHRTSNPRGLRPILPIYTSDTMDRHSLRNFTSFVTSVRWRKPPRSAAPRNNLTFPSLRFPSRSSNWKTNSARASSTVSAEEARAEFVFQFEDLLGKRRLGNVRLFRGAAERGGFRHRTEVTKLVKFHRLCLSIVSEVYIGSIGRSPLGFEVRWQRARFAGPLPSN